MYQSLLNPKIRVQIAYVGKNWEIKDAVNKGEIPDDRPYHTFMFWHYKNDETLVAVDYSDTPAGFFDGLEEGWELVDFPYVYPLERFQQQYEKLN